jgi:cysteine desulfurase / selenocysteine lyase
MAGSLMTQKQERNLFDVDRIRKDFPVLRQQANGYPLAYLDNAATTQKPQVVIQRITDFYTNEYATIHRGVYSLSAKATIAYESARHTVANLLNAPSTEEIIFTKGTTEAINLVASSYGRMVLQPGDEVIISAMEHHSNIVPWQQLCESIGAHLKVIPMDDSGELLMDAYATLLSDKTRIVAVNHISNALGTINPVKQIIKMAHEKGAVVLIDGAQSVPHMAVDVQDLDCDFYAFSGHKLYGPTGIGVLYGKMKHFQAMPPYQFGGDMIESVRFEKTTFAKTPHKFEAGTPPIVEVLGLGAAIDYVQQVGYSNIQAYEQELLHYATAQLLHLEGLRIIGTAKDKAGVISFVFEDIHPHDVGTLLDGYGIAVRAGHHCTQPVMERFNIPATTRASFSFYNTKEEIDRLVDGLQRVIQVFR